MACPKCKSEKEFRYKDKSYCANCGEELQVSETLSPPKKTSDVNKQLSSVFSEMAKHLNIKEKPEHKETGQV
ncbi:MAG: hypothetical protein GTN40_00270, partial [Candidatus Aenigmarchaeota archaeon]|nr:hypothetical protein [Candidatus Aenigmarchaeota archaeon]